MSAFDITVEAGASVRLPTGGKYCDRDIVVTATGGGDDGLLKNIIERKVSSATDYTLPSDLTRIGNSAFSNYITLPLTALPDGVTYIDHMAFQNCRAITLTALPDGVTFIGNSVFSGCTNLALTSLPEGVTSIGTQAFYCCTGLTELTFRGTPTSIAANAFKGCTNLLTINVPWAEGAVANAPWGATNATINYDYQEE